MVLYEVAGTAALSAVTYGAWAAAKIPKVAAIYARIATKLNKWGVLSKEVLDAFNDFRRMLDKGTDSPNKGETTLQGIDGP